jgi:hypothetical protein
VPLRWVNEVAAELGVDPDLLYRLMKEGKLARYRNWPDKRTYVDEAQVRAALDFQLESGPEPKQRSRLRSYRELAKEQGWSSEVIERLAAKGLVAKYRRRGDQRTYVDEEQVLTAHRPRGRPRRGEQRGWRRLSGPPPE